MLSPKSTQKRKIGIQASIVGVFWKPNRPCADSPSGRPAPAGRRPRRPRAGSSRSPWPAPRSSGRRAVSSRKLRPSTKAKTIGVQWSTRSKKSLLKAGSPVDVDVGRWCPRSLRHDVARAACSTALIDAGCVGVGGQIDASRSRGRRPGSTAAVDRATGAWIARRAPRSACRYRLGSASLIAVDARSRPARVGRPRSRCEDLIGVLDLAVREGFGAGKAGVQIEVRDRQRDQQVRRRAPGRPPDGPSRRG